MDLCNQFNRGAIIVVCVFMVSGVAVFAQGPQKAPVNPELLEWLADKAVGDDFGQMPEPMDWSHLRPQPTKELPPASFDLRDSGSLTSVKYQSSCGACWAFAACGVLEAWLKNHHGQTHDFSENHMKNTHGFEAGHCAGGNNQMVTAYLARWSGPLAESDDPYNPSQVVPPLPGAQVQKRVLSAPIFVTTGGDRSEIQQALMQYGALSVSMVWRDTDYNSATRSYFYAGGAGGYGHMVVLVGWDDDKVVPGAPGNGAWICKNSWGATWGESGYFHISYYDVEAAKRAYGFFPLIEPDAHSRVYQYDPLGQIGAIGTGTNDVFYGANVFTAEADETIVAVGTHAMATNTAYEITVYGGGISGGAFSNPLATISGVFLNAGYYVVDLPEGVPVTAGNPFSVVVRYHTPGYSYPLPVEQPEGGYAQPTAALGQSYMSPDGMSFQDIHGYGSGWENTNACIKAMAAANQSEGEETNSLRIIGRPRVELGDTVLLRVLLPDLVGETTFAWYKDNVLIPHAQSDQYHIASVTYADAGVYRLVVTDESKGLYESGPFALQVFPEGSMPLSGAVALGALALLLAFAGARQTRRR